MALPAIADRYRGHRLGYPLLLRPAGRRMGGAQLHAERGDLGVIEHDRHHGDRAQTINVLAISQVRTGC